MRAPTLLAPRPPLSRALIGRNLLSGLIVGVIAFPLAIALAVAVGAPPVWGLYTAAFAGATASLAGGSRFNITGPTAALVPLLSHAVIQHGIEALPMLGLLAGLLLVAMGLARFGRLVRFMPQLVIVGFTAGIAISIAAGQLNNLLGLSGTNGRLEYFHERIWDSLHHLGTAEPSSVGIGLACLVFLFAYQARPRRVPGPLLAVIGATLAVRLLDLDASTVASRYGDLPRSIPTPHVGFLDAGLALDLLPTAAALAVLAGVESLLSAVVADGMASDGVRHDPDRELIGQGLANVVAPFMYGIPATAAIARTAAGVRSGATSRLSGIFHAATVLALTVVFAGTAGQIPLAALAAILIVVAYSIADVPELSKLLRSAPREDLLALVGTVLVTVFLDLTFAIALGVITSTVLLLRRLIRVPVAEAMLPDRPHGPAIPPAVSAFVHAHPEVLFFNAQGVISFHSAAEFEAMLPRRDPRPLVIRMHDIHHVDSSGLITLEGVIEHRHRAGGVTVLTDVSPQVEAALRRFGIPDCPGFGGIAAHTEAALQLLANDPEWRPGVPVWSAPPATGEVAGGA